MALLDDIILHKGQIVLTQTSGSVVGIDLQNSPFQFGTVAVTSDLSEMFAVGDSVLYSTKDVIMFSQNGEVYYLTTEDKVLFKELPPA